MSIDNKQFHSYIQIPNIESMILEIEIELVVQRWSQLIGPKKSSQEL